MPTEIEIGDLFLTDIWLNSIYRIDWSKKRKNLNSAKFYLLYNQSY